VSKYKKVLLTTTRWCQVSKNIATNFAWKVIQVCTVSGPHNIPVSKYKKCSLQPPGGVRCQKKILPKNFFWKVTPIIHILKGMFSSRLTEIYRCFRWLPVIRSVRDIDESLYQTIDSGIQLKFFESYVAFSRTFAPIAGCPKKNPAIVWSFERCQASKNSSQWKFLVTSSQASNICWLTEACSGVWKTLSRSA
jgi:hypothetical protein